jgi:serine/threonine protein kinase
VNPSNSKQVETQHNMAGREIGPYRILQKLAQGALCSVYKGMHTGLEQEVAIKVLLPEYFDDKNLRERFIKEARIQAGISHPNVVRTLNFIENDQTAMMVMEYVNGETLDVLLRKARVLPPQRALAILQSVLDALDFMHSKGIVHRDLKPSNIMVSYDGFVKVMDFGIAKMQGDNSKTKTGIRIGTLWYMSPEQIKGEKATTLSDIYSIGVTMYQMLTGVVPFDGDTEFEIMKGHIEKKPVPPWKINKELDITIGEVVLKAISKNPRDRFQSVKELLANVQSAVKTTDTSKIATQSFNIRQVRPVWFQRTPAIGWKAFSSAAVLLVVVVAFASFYLLSDKTGEAGSHKNMPPQAAQAVKPPLPVVNEPLRPPVASAAAITEPIVSAQTKGADENTAAPALNVSKNGKSVNRSAKPVAKRSVRKGPRSSSRQYAGYSGEKKKTQQSVRTSTPKEKKPDGENAWSIRK